MIEDTIAAPALPGSEPMLVAGAPCTQDDLSAYTKVPPERLGEFLFWTPAKLQRETRQVARILVRFANAVLESMESSSAADEFVRSLDLASISRDHDWRVIFAAIRDEGRADDDFRHQALVKYFQYLSFRKRLLEFIYARRQGLAETWSYSAPPTDAGIAPSRNEGGSNAGEDAKGYYRLPPGEAVDLDLSRRSPHKLVLAGYVLCLHGARPPVLRDKHGAVFRLRHGRNVVGRHPESDIALDPGLNAISRAHLVLDWDGAEGVSVTDLSSAGTLLRIQESASRISRRRLD